jgi:hypothetical protein
VLAWRLAMLAFALWLAFRLIGWLRWAWACASTGGWWKPLPQPVRANTAAPASAPGADADSAGTEPPPLPTPAASD